MNNLLHKTMYQFTASGNKDAPSAGYESNRATLPADVIVSLNPSKSIREGLFRQGYGCLRYFAVLPSPTSPCWLLPLTNRHTALGGLEIYKPYAMRARFMKHLLTALLKAHFERLMPYRVVVASRGFLPLENLVREITGEAEPVFSFSIGTEVRFRKVTLEVMRPDGRVLGFIKLPLTQAAAERIRYEAEVARNLYSFPALQVHVPRVLYSGSWGDGEILYEEAAPSKPGPVRLNRQCHEFLQLLQGIHTAQKSGCFLWEDVAARWKKAEADLPNGWRDLGRAVLAKTHRELQEVVIAYGVTHGDFAPWNMRIGDQGLYVFDWESASWEAPVSWDVFHFETQVAALLNGRNSVPDSGDGRQGEKASFLLYLLDSACRLLREKGPAQGRALAYRLRLLSHELGVH